MFVDEAIISIKGGNGGRGAATFYPGVKTGPSGGNGGNGGNVYVHGDRNMADLHTFASTTKFAAKNGEPGANFDQHGANGEDLILRVPVGTLVIDREHTRYIEIDDTTTVHLIARGGRGGKGNAFFASSTNQSPQQFEVGQEGQKQTIRLILRLIADFGLIGLPNAGKSSLLNELTSAKVKTALYPFTTLEPNLGVFVDRVIADIPGLIEGASHGKGLGTKFLKHIEKVPILLHCIASDSDDIMRDYTTVIHELEQYNPELMKKPRVILLTKTDLISEQELKERMKQLKTEKLEIIPVSIYNPDQFFNLQKKLQSL